MIRFVLYCLPVVRRIARPRLRAATRVQRTVRRGAGIAAAAKAGAVAVAVGGPACFLLPIWGGSGTPVLPPAPAPIAVPYAGPLVPSGSVFDAPSVLGGFGSPLDRMDFAALVPTPGISVIPPHDVLVVVPPGPTTETPPVSVPEPPAVVIFAAALVLLAGVRRRA